MEVKLILLASGLLTMASAGAAQIEVKDGFGNPVVVSDNPYWEGDAPANPPDGMKGYSSPPGHAPTGGGSTGNSGVGHSGSSGGGGGQGSPGGSSAGGNGAGSSGSSSSGSGNS